MLLRLIALLLVASALSGCIYRSSYDAPQTKVKVECPPGTRPDSSGLCL